MDLKQLCSHRKSQIILVTLLSLQEGFIIIRSYMAMFTKEFKPGVGWRTGPPISAVTAVKICLHQLGKLRDSLDCLKMKFHKVKALRPTSSYALTAPQVGSHPYSTIPLVVPAQQRGWYLNKSRDLAFQEKHETQTMNLSPCFYYHYSIKLWFHCGGRNESMENRNALGCYFCCRPNLMKPELNYT